MPEITWQGGPGEPSGVRDLAAIELDPRGRDGRLKAVQSAAPAAQLDLHLAERRELLRLDPELLAQLAQCGLRGLLAAPDPAPRDLPLTRSIRVAYEQHVVPVRDEELDAPHARREHEPVHRQHPVGDPEGRPADRDRKLHESSVRRGWLLLSESRADDARLVRAMKTYVATPADRERNWLLVDATGQTLGRLSTQIADALRGKRKPVYTPHVDTGDFVIVINAEKVAVTGNKRSDKLYYRHSGYPGGLKSRTLAEMLERRPEEVIRLSVKGMLPRNRLARKQLTKLKIYAGPEHPHAAQQPQPMEIEQ